MKKNDSLPPVWPAKAHTLAKHAILQNYLKAWMPILSASSSTREILYVDGFAGPGRYENGEDGSPVIAIKTALEHPLQFPIPVKFLFIENDPERHQILSGVIAGYRSRAAQEPRVQIEMPIQGDCTTVLGGRLQTYKQNNQPFGPALVFLDQFGYSAVPISLISSIMENPKCEVFSYLEWTKLGWFLSDQTKWEGITRAFGGDEWKAALDMPKKQKELHILNSYLNALKTRGKAKYVYNFSMHDEKGELTYWLFFCTNDLRGLEVMKKAMCSVDQAGTYRFSDQDTAGQDSMFEGYNSDWLSVHLLNVLEGETRTIDQIREYILTETPCFKFKEALETLEREGSLHIITPPAGRKKYSFPDAIRSMKVKFERTGLFGN
jgi:three-Cys-motif partner protein